VYCYHYNIFGPDFISIQFQSVCSPGKWAVRFSVRTCVFSNRDTRCNSQHRRASTHQSRIYVGGFETVRKHSLKCLCGVAGMGAKVQIVTLPAGEQKSGITSRERDLQPPFVFKLRKTVIARRGVVVRKESHPIIHFSPRQNKISLQPITKDCTLQE
jgi:hypothetical protein